MRVVAIVGMSGAGKSEIAGVFEENGFVRVRFGDLTDEELARRGLPQTEENESRIRRLLREEHGMSAYAKLNLPRIDSALERSRVVVDGLYSWEEYVLMKRHYGDSLCVVAVYSSPGARRRRLVSRPRRPLTVEQSISRDFDEIEKANKGGPIAMADVTIVNESSLEDLRQRTQELVRGSFK
ncbi:MAG: AAA family ATPase [Dehalococcoidia bacterium]|nr:AAA family ATPase [Dehalococcoidia bacterium]